MKKVIMIALLFISALTVNAQQSTKSSKDDVVTGVSVAYSYSNAVVLDLTQKDPNGIILGFGGSRELTKELKGSAFGVLGYEFGQVEVKSRVGLRTANGTPKAVYGGVVSLATAVKKVRYILGYDNYNKFQSGIGLVF
jgi:hypothetical protein